MKRRGCALFTILVGVSLLALLLSGEMQPIPAQAKPAIPAKPTPTPDQARVLTALQNTPLMFIENTSQTDAGARFQVHSGNTTLYLTDDALWFSILEPPQMAEAGITQSDFPVHRENPKSKSGRGINLKVSFVGANPHPRLEPLHRLDTHISYFIGNDPKQWRTNIPAWAGVRYINLYPGVDLEVTSQSGQWVWRLVVGAGTSPGVKDPSPLQNVRLRVDGADAVTLEGNHLRLITALGEFRLPLLEAVTIDGTPLELTSTQPEVSGLEITAPFSLSSHFPPASSALPFSVPAQQSTSTLLYSTFLGGSDSDVGHGIAVDGSGAAYIIGYTYGGDFPTTPGAFDRTINTSPDTFVVKLNATGSGLVYATFLGGNSNDYGRDIAVDGSGAAYVTGETYSSDFPTPASSGYDKTYNGGFDAFVVKLNATGSALNYNTFLGGSDWDMGYDIAVDGSGAAYVTGFTESSDFPTSSSNGYDKFYNGGTDAFVVKLNATGSTLTYNTFLGGSSGDIGNGIAVDGSGTAYVTGHTSSSDFPTPSSNGYDKSYNGNFDAFVVKLNATGSALSYNTFLGGSNTEYGNDIAVDGSGAAYVTGHTLSSDFPTPSSNGYDKSYNGNFDAFVVKLNATGSALSYNTFLGGINNDEVHDIAVDGSGAAYVTGETWSSDFPTPSSGYDKSFNGILDAFVVKLNATGSALTYNTFLGGSNFDQGQGIAVDGSGNFYITGYTDSAGFPIKVGTYDTSQNGSNDIFVAKLRVPTGVFLPIVLKGPVIDFSVKNETGGVLKYYRVFDTPQGTINCPDNILNGATVFCDTFSSGTYNVAVESNGPGCGAATALLNFPPGTCTRIVRCGGNPSEWQCN